jgi:hypothetical protein
MGIVIFFVASRARTDADVAMRATLRFAVLWIPTALLIAAAASLL